MMSRLRTFCCGLSVPALAFGAVLAGATPSSAAMTEQPQVLHFTTAAPTGVTAFARYGAVVLAEASSGLPVTLSVDPSSSQVCSVASSEPIPGSGNISIQQAGTCRVNADQAGNEQYAPADRITVSFDVSRIPTQLAAAKASKNILGLTPTTFRADLSYFGWFGPSQGYQPLLGQPVSFSLGGKTVCTGTTVHVQDGSFFGAARATCKATIGLNAATKYRSYKATFAGTPGYADSTATADLK
jgi:hypothetical protein